MSKSSMMALDQREKFEQGIIDKYGEGMLDRAMELYDQGLSPSAIMKKLGKNKGGVVKLEGGGAVGHSRGGRAALRGTKFVGVR